MFFLEKQVQNPYVIVSVVNGLNMMTIYEVPMILTRVFYPYKSQIPTYLQYSKNYSKVQRFYVATSFQKLF